MNPLWREAARMLEGGWIMGVMTVVFVVCFVGWTWWAFAKHNRQKFEDAAMLPLTTGDDP
jgi:cbb3-type cytochrome oxidase subunit 3